MCNAATTSACSPARPTTGYGRRPSYATTPAATVVSSCVSDGCRQRRLQRPVRGGGAVRRNRHADGPVSMSFTDNVRETQFRAGSPTWAYVHRRCSQNVVFRPPRRRAVAPPTPTLSPTSEPPTRTTPAPTAEPRPSLTPTAEPTSEPSAGHLSEPTAAPAAEPFRASESRGSAHERAHRQTCFGPAEPPRSPAPGPRRSYE